ncbi:hypothetical protein [Nitrosospira sp. Nsp2]|uniref:hypothetical protein n=1 Tax=Nitrosospira sp. Nsp2 TaxID=136548 RepID=UPI0015E66DCB|nr:hypothetical protein [Nitrosospira sp. Nsp2]
MRHYICRSILTAHPFLKSISKNSNPVAQPSLPAPRPPGRHRPAKMPTQYVFTGGEKHFSEQQRGMREFRIFRDALKSEGPATIQLYNLHVHGESYRNSIDVKRVFQGGKPSVMNIRHGGAFHKFDLRPLANA